VGTPRRFNSSAAFRKEKGKRGELKSLKATVECSNPKVYAAWKEAGETNLDLLNVLLAVREDNRRETAKNLN